MNLAGLTLLEEKSQPCLRRGHGIDLPAQFRALAALAPVQRNA